MMTKMVSYFITSDKNINIFLNDKSYIISTDHINYIEIISTLKIYAKEELFDRLATLVDVANSIKNTSEKIEIKNGVVYFAGQAINNSLTRHLLMLIMDNLPYEPLWNFINNVALNPSKYAIDELYEFLEKNNMPITDDGCFLAYKKIKNDYTDIHTGKFNNSVGKLVEMPREDVNSNRNITCSSGLHFCSKEYLPEFSNDDGTDRVIIVKINPRDVVSFPTDYNLTKGRCCAYEVVYELGIWSEINKDSNAVEFDQHTYTKEDIEVKKNNPVANAWSEEDYQLLFSIVTENNTWVEISKEFNKKTTNQNRTPSACRHAWIKRN